MWSGEGGFSPRPSDERLLSGSRLAKQPVDGALLQLPQHEALQVEHLRRAQDDRVRQTLPVTSTRQRHWEREQGSRE
jgi:hypothetical protein